MDANTYYLSNINYAVLYCKHITIIMFLQVIVQLHCFMYNITNSHKKISKRAFSVTIFIILFAANVMHQQEFTNDMH